MNDLTEKQILLIQIIADLKSAKETCDEQGFLGIDEVNWIIDKVKKVKDIEDAEVDKAEKEGAFDPDDKDWPEAHGAHDTESGSEV